MTKLAGYRMKLRRCNQLLAQIRRCIDQKPVLAVGTDRDRCLDALKLGMFGSRCPANRTSAIPLRNATTCRGAEDDDAKHDSSPGNSEASRSQNIRRWPSASTRPRGWERVMPDGPPC